MNSINENYRIIAPRKFMAAQDLQVLWRIESGSMRIDSISDDGKSHFVRLAFAGDLLGIENFVGVKEQLSVSALTKTKLELVVFYEDKHLLQILSEAISIAHQRCREVVCLRTGAIEDRINFLVAMLTRAEIFSTAPAKPTKPAKLPSLANMAEIVHSSPETVCRVLTILRKKQTLKTSPVNAMTC